MIITVPHSGSRSLSKHLGESFFHFHDMKLIDVPVRDPLAHVISWICYEGSDDNAGGFYEQCEKMIFLGWPHRYHKVEDIPVYDGVGPSRNHPLRKALEARDIRTLRKEIPRFFLWMKREEIREFYERFYDLWYLR